VADRWGLALVTLLIAACIAVLLVSTARAQELEAPDLPELVVEACPGAADLHQLELDDGGPGFWFPRETSRCMLGRIRVLAEAVPYIRQLETRIAETDARDALQVRRVGLAEEEALAAVGALGGALARAGRAEDALEAWFRHPAFWVGVGVVLVVLIEIVAVWALHQVD
jgi:hypothetical protein